MERNARSDASFSARIFKYPPTPLRSRTAPRGGGRDDSSVGENSVTYEEFLAAKICLSAKEGLPDAFDAKLPSILKPHQVDIVRWALAGGRRAIFASFGLGKTIIQLCVADTIARFTGSRFLIVAPLGVRGEFMRDAAMLGLTLRFIRSHDEAEETGLYLTNYEPVRDGKLDPRKFAGASLDEAACLRAFGGSKTFREFMRLFDGIRYKFVATATPSPNDFIELLAYSAFLEVLDVSEAKTRFFKRNSEKADELTVHPHKEEEFCLWVSTWAMFIDRPSDLGHSDEGYVMPELDLHWHEIESEYSGTDSDPSGQLRLVRSAAAGVVEAAREKRDSLNARIAKMLELRATDPAAHRVIWHDLEDERRAIESALPQCATVYGAQDLDAREEIVSTFSNGEIPELAAKPVMLGSGCNLQRHCSWAIYLGIGFKFNDFIQSIHRLQRFLQTKRVRIDLIYTTAERGVRAILEQKWEQHKELCRRMKAIVQEYGMNHAAMFAAMRRGTGVKRIEASGEAWKAVNSDCVLETWAMESDSVHLVLTSIPFGNQYEYSPNYADFGHSDDPDHFWQQMDYLIPELLRVLKPGRICAIHVKDRITPGGINKLGFQTVYPFHADGIRAFTKHGFAYLGMKTIVTDVVRENNQTYRLGWTEQCKDGTKMGVGMPEYLLIFRKPQTDTMNAYADDPVVKEKGAYSRARWQVDAHGFARSSGDRPLTPEELRTMDHGQIFRRFREYFTRNVYDYETHIRLGEELSRCSECGHVHVGRKRCAVGECKCVTAASRLPVTFMLLQPPSWSDEVWSDVTRMLGMNSLQAAKGKEGHLCPMQFDIADRAITQYTMEGETVYDPFAGLFTVPVRALKLGRRGIGCELSTPYFATGVGYLQAEEAKLATPGLFDFIEAEATASAELRLIAGESLEQGRGSRPPQGKSG